MQRLEYKAFVVTHRHKTEIKRSMHIPTDTTFVLYAIHFPTLKIKLAILMETEVLN